MYIYVCLLELDLYLCMLHPYEDCLEDSCVARNLFICLGRTWGKCPDLRPSVKEGLCLLTV